MYSNVKSRLKVYENLGNDFYRSLGVRQGKFFSPVLFSLCLNDFKKQFIRSGFEGLDIVMSKSFMHL